MWTSKLGATFSSSTNATTKYHVPDVSTATTDIITITATDNCSRQNFTKKTIAVVPSTLPIKLKSFTVYATSKGVQVDWTTASEINNDNFSIQRSPDDINYAEAGNVRGAGNSTILLNYSFIDEHPFSGTSYYRLKQTDFDGRSETFHAVSITLEEKLNETNSIHIFPNPFINEFTIYLDKAYSYFLYDICGRLIEKGEHLKGKISTGENLVPGIYLIEMDEDKNKEFFTVVKSQ